MRTLEIAVDLRTARLIKLLQAALLAEEITKESAARLIGRAKAIRLLAEAGERHLAVEVVEDLRQAIETVTESSPWFKAMEFHCQQVQAALEHV